MMNVEGSAWMGIFKLLGGVIEVQGAGLGERKWT